MNLLQDKLQDLSASFTETQHYNINAGGCAKFAFEIGSILGKRDFYIVSPLTKDLWVWQTYGINSVPHIQTMIDGRLYDSEGFTEEIVAFVDYDTDVDTIPEDTTMFAIKIETEKLLEMMRNPHGWNQTYPNSGVEKVMKKNINKILIEDFLLLEHSGIDILHN